MLFDLESRRRLWSIDPDKVVEQTGLGGLEAGLDADGTVLLASVTDSDSKGPGSVFAVSPTDGKPRRLPHDIRCSFSCSIKAAGGRFAYLRALDDGFALVVVDYAGAVTTIATFGPRARSIGGFDFDGTRITYETRYERRYRGKKDAGYQVACYSSGQANVITEAPVIHTRVLGQPEAVAPRVPAPRTFSRKKPNCPKD